MIDSVYFTVLVPVVIAIPRSSMIPLIEKTEDIIAAQSDKIIGTPSVFIDDMLSQASYDGIISLPEGWEMPLDSNKPLDKKDYRLRRASDSLAEKQ